MPDVDLLKNYIESQKRQREIIESQKRRREEKIRETKKGLQIKNKKYLVDDLISEDRQLEEKKRKSPIRAEKFAWILSNLIGDYSDAEFAISLGYYSLNSEGIAQPQIEEFRKEKLLAEKLLSEKLIKELNVEDLYENPRCFFKGRLCQIVSDLDMFIYIPRKKIEASKDLFLFKFKPHIFNPTFILKREFGLLDEIGDSKEERREKKDRLQELIPQYMDSFKKQFYLEIKDNDFKEEMYAIRIYSVCCIDEGLTKFSRDKLIHQSNFEQIAEFYGFKLSDCHCGNWIWIS